MEAAAVTDICEDELTRWLFTASVSSHLIASELNLSSSTQLIFMTDTRALVPTARGPGDIDVLAIDARCPEQAVAIEVKRIKMTSDSYLTSQPNKVRELKKGSLQVAHLRKIGFHRAYLLVAVVADGREQTGLGFAFRGPTPALVRAVKEKLRSLDFHPDVGVVVVEATQPVNKDIYDAGAIGIWTHQRASPIQQNSELTARIATLCAAQKKFAA